MRRGKRSLGYSQLSIVQKESKLLNELQKNLIDLNGPLLLLHSHNGNLSKLSIYS